MDLLITLVITLLLYLWLISRKAFLNPLYLAFFGYHAFRSMDKNEKTIAADLVIEFCEIHIGKSRKKPKLDIIDKKHKMDLGKNAGQYQVETMTIKINGQYARSMYSLVRIILHEYAHHMQFMAFAKEDYHRIFEDPKVKYSNHPWENQARCMEKDFWKACIEYVLMQLGYFEKD